MRLELNFELGPKKAKELKNSEITKLQSWGPATSQDRLDNLGERTEKLESALAVLNTEPTPETLDYVVHLKDATVVSFQAHGYYFEGNNAVFKIYSSPHGILIPVSSFEAADIKFITTKQAKVIHSKTTVSTSPRRIREQ